MTQRTKDFLKRAAYWAALLFPAFGGAWSVARWADSRKLDVSRFVADSAVMSTESNAFRSDVTSALRDLKTSLDSVNLRLRQIQCGSAVERGCR